MRSLGVLTVMVLVASPWHARSAPSRNVTIPILVELFTSEGCSSCPLADAWLQQLDASHPVPGAQLIVLSEHVDYWNHDGWIDPYSSFTLTDRQSGYVRSLGLMTPCTPQVIVDGQNALRLYDPKHVSAILLKPENAALVPVSISAVRVEGGAPATLRAHVEVDGTPEKCNADVYASIALDHVESQVLHGENGGRHLTHVAVEEQFPKVGKLERGKPSQDFLVSLKPGMDAKNLRLIAFAQYPALGNVLGATLQEIEHSSK